MLNINLGKKKYYLVGFAKKINNMHLNTKSIWKHKHEFMDKLLNMQNNLIKINKFHDYNKYYNCLLEQHINITKGYYEHKQFIWDDGLMHYILEHNYKPNINFINFVNEYMKKYIYSKKNINMRSKIYHIDDMKFIKIKKNQILIMDALLNHGGFTKKYNDEYNLNLFRYSEHAGLLDFDKNKLKNIIISANVNYTNEKDNEIFFPSNIPNILSYEYVMHTHPPTPFPGGRIDDGILYDFPSYNDIDHFTHYSNKGKIQGSIVIASEGMYVIRRLNLNNKIMINDIKNFKFLYNKCNFEQQDKSIIEYKNEFEKNKEIFFSKIAQDFKYINNMNFFLKDYNLYIAYYSRKKNPIGEWIIDDIYLPVSAVEIKK
jgi:hypothetical protein